MNYTSVLMVGFGIIAVLYIWRRYCKTMLDTVRDELFDIRDDLRKTFKESSSLDNPVYLTARKYMNSYIHGIDKMSFLGFLYLEILLDKNTATADHIQHGIDEAFRSDDAFVQKEIWGMRRRTNRKIEKYLMKTSLTFFVFTMTLTVILAFKNGCRSVDAMKAVVAKYIENKVVGPITIESGTLEPCVVHA